jgi:hypothetical protein
MAVTRIMSILFEASTVSGKTLQSDIEQQVRQIVDLVKDVALQFGLHSAHLRLLYPDHGEEIRIGEEYHDCVDDDMSTGETFSVDLVTLPGLQRVGDGRSDVQAKRTLIACDVYPFSKKES